MKGQTPQCLLFQLNYLRVPIEVTLGLIRISNLLVLLHSVHQHLPCLLNALNMVCVCGHSFANILDLPAPVSWLGKKICPHGLLSLVFYPLAFLESSLFPLPSSLTPTSSSTSLTSPPIAEIASYQILFFLFLHTAGQDFRISLEVRYVLIVWLCVLE